MRENGPKAENSFTMHAGKWENLDQNIGKSSLLSIFRYSVTIVSHYKKI